MLNKTIQKDILNVIAKAKKSVKNDDTLSLKELSDQTLHNAATYQDKFSINIAILFYSLAKIFDRKLTAKYPNFNIFKNRITATLTKLESAMKQNDLQRCNANLSLAFELVHHLEKGFGLYIIEVIKQAKIKKASRILEHGISTGRAAELLGISKWDLMHYLGQTKIFNKEPSMSLPVKKRMDYVKEAFEK